SMPTSPPPTRRRALLSPLRRNSKNQIRNHNKTPKSKSEEPRKTRTNPQDLSFGDLEIELLGFLWFFEFGSWDFPWVLWIYSFLVLAPSGGASCSSEA